MQQLEDIGLLRLGLSSTGGTVAFVPAGSTTTHLEPAGDGDRQVCGRHSGPLASIAAAGGNQGLGLVTGGLGVRQKNTCSSAEGRVSGTEQITVALGSAFDDDVFVDAVELDIEGKFDADLAVSLDGARPLARALFSSSDNGPDSGISDNDRVLVSTAEPDVHPFRSMTLSAAGGEIALEGGGDATYAQYVRCGQGRSARRRPRARPTRSSSSCASVTSPTTCRVTRPGRPTVIGGSADAATINRLDNLEGAADLRGRRRDVRDHSTTACCSTRGRPASTAALPQAVHAVVDIVWAAQAAAVPLPAREINFDPADPAGWEMVQWCTSWDPVTQTAVHPPDARLPGWRAAVVPRRRARRAAGRRDGRPGPALRRRRRSRCGVERTASAHARDSTPTVGRRPPVPVTTPSRARTADSTPPTPVRRSRDADEGNGSSRRPAASRARSRDRAPWRRGSRLRQASLGLADAIRPRAAPRR